MPLALLFVFLLFSPSTAAGAAPPEQNFGRMVRAAEIARTNGNVQDAISQYRGALRIRPSWTEGYWWLGTIYYDQDRFSEAQKAFSEFVSRAPNPAPGYAFLALCEFETRNFPPALQHFRLWARAGSPGTPQLISVANYRWAMLLSREGQFRQALFLLSREVSERGESPVLVEAMGLAGLHMRMLPDEYPQGRRELVWLVGESMMYMTLRDFYRAHEYSERMLRHYSKEPGAHYVAGLLLNLEGKSREASQEFRKELEISRQNIDALVDLALFRLNESDAAEAASLAQEAVKLDPQNSGAVHLLGRALLELGRGAEALRYLETARTLAPKNPTIRFDLAKAYKAVGRSAESDRELATFTALKEKEKQDFQHSPAVTR